MLIMLCCRRQSLVRALASTSPKGSAQRDQHASGRMSRQPHLRARTPAGESSALRPGAGPEHTVLRRSQPDPTPVLLPSLSSDPTPIRLRPSRPHPSVSPWSHPDPILIPPRSHPPPPRSPPLSQPDHITGRSGKKSGQWGQERRRAVLTTMRPYLIAIHPSNRPRLSHQGCSNPPLPIWPDLPRSSCHIYRNCHLCASLANQPITHRRHWMLWLRMYAASINLGRATAALPAGGST